MKYDQTFVVTLDFNSPVEIISDDKDWLIKKIKSIYEHMNYKGSYIDEIITAIPISDWSIIKGRLDGSINVDVQFTAIIQKYVRGDLVPTAKVISNNSHIIICEYDSKMKIVLNPSQNIDGIRVGQYIPVQLQITQYDQFTPFINTIGTVLTTDKDFIVYKTSGEFPHSMLSKIEMNINNAITERNILDNVLIDKLEHMFWKGDGDICSIGKWTGVVNSIDNMVNIFEIKNQPDFVYIYVPVEINKSSPFVVMSKNPPKDIDRIKEENMSNVISILLTNMLNYLNLANEMAQLFKDNTLYTDHVNIWAIINSLK